MLVSASDQTDMEVVIHKLYIRMENKWRHFAVRRFVKNKHCLFFFNSMQLPTPRNMEWGCTTRFTKLLPYLGGGVAEWFRVLDLKSGDPWFKSLTLALSGFVLGSTEFNSSTASCK